MCSSSSTRKTESAFGIDCDYLATGSNVCSVFIHFFMVRSVYFVSKVKFPNSGCYPAFRRHSVYTEATVGCGRRRFKKMQHYNQYKDSKNIAWLYPTATILIGTCVKNGIICRNHAFPPRAAPPDQTKKPLRTSRKGFSLYNFRN